MRWWSAIAGIAIVAALTLGPAALGQPTLKAPLVDWSHAQRAHRLAQEWTADAAVPPALPREPIPVTGVSAVRVTLRWVGVTVGVGEADVQSLPPDAAGVTDLATLTRAATSAALLNTTQTMIDSHRRAIRQGRAKRDSAPMPLASLGPRLLVDLQVAGGAQPIVLAPDTKAGDVYRQFAPGFHGLTLTAPALAGAPGTSARLWPASAIATNTQPANQLLQLLANVGLDARQLEHVAKPRGPRLERFEVIHIARPSHTLPPTHLVRGHLPVPTASLSEAQVANLAQRLASHLRARQQPDGSMHATYLPTSDQFEFEQVQAGKNPQDEGMRLIKLASPQDVALCAYALARHATSAERAGNAGLEVLHADAAVRRAIEHLIPLLVDAKTSLDAGGASLLLLTLAEVRSLDRKPQRDALVDRLLELQNEAGGFRAAPDPKSRPMDRVTQSLVLAGLSSVYQQTRQESLGQALVRGRDQLWRQMQPSPPASALPWLLVLDRNLLTLDGAAPAQLAEHSARYRQLADALRQRQITEPPALGPDDVVGGFALDDASPSLGAPNPDWRSAVAVTFLASALRDPAIVGQRNPLDWLLSCGQGARFLSQLVFDEASCFYVRSPGDALGALRPTFTDNRLTIPPTAMALLATAELRATIAELSSAAHK